MILPKPFLVPIALGLVFKVGLFMGYFSEIEGATRVHFAMLIICAAFVMCGSFLVIFDRNDKK